MRPGASHLVRRSQTLPALAAGWQDTAWAEAEPLGIVHFHPRSSAHRPPTGLRLLHDDHSVAGIFRVEDRYVLARATTYQSPTHKDSCVEAFFLPKPGFGYFNFEFNALGTLLLWYIDRPRRPDGSFEHVVPVPAELGRSIAVATSLREPIVQEEMRPLVWTLSFRIPVASLEAYVGALGALSGQRWRVNFYKCADDSSHPHWGAWSDIGERLDFHQPDRFGALLFE